MYTPNVKMGHCLIVAKRLLLPLGEIWKKFDPLTTGVRETYLQEQNVCSAANRAGVLNAWPAGNANGVVWR